jgi:hypothetical protein
MVVVAGGEVVVVAGEGLWQWWSLLRQRWLWLWVAVVVWVF